VDPATDRRLGRAALIVTAVLLLTVAVTAAIALRPRGGIDIPAEWRSPSGYTLVIFGRTTCAACAASAAFHRDLVAAAHARGVRVVAASTGSAREPGVFAASIGAAPDEAVRAIPAPKNLTTVPAIVLMSGDGRILKQTAGVLALGPQRDWIGLVSTVR
jgi:hypothetical protein